VHLLFCDGNNSSRWVGPFLVYQRNSGFSVTPADYWALYMGCRVLTGDFVKKKSSEENKVSGGWAVTLLLLFSCLHAYLESEV
jgi:hypothetical protein